jgi:hypothetical protein
MRFGLLVLLAGCFPAVPYKADDDSVGGSDGTENQTCIRYVDLDADGWGGSNEVELPCSEEPPLQVATVGGDCDDTDPTIHPDTPEVCDDADQDCDGQADEGLLSDWYPDADGDGFGERGAPISSCEPEDAWVREGLDCNDDDPTIHPDADEVCDGVDQNCDELVDNDPTDGTRYFPDVDEDGAGDRDAGEVVCESPEGWIEVGGDCDDTNPAINPDAAEICSEGIDEDCDGAADDEDPDVDLTTGQTWYADADGDGLGDGASSLVACTAPDGWTEVAGDCDDSGFSDPDGDLLQDCEDPDDDGDGLRDGWDGDPTDPTVITGPLAGLGTDGDLTVAAASSWIMPSGSLLIMDAFSGDETLWVENTAGWGVGSELLILAVQGPDAGLHQLVYISDLPGDGEVTIEPPLTDDMLIDNVVVVWRVPHWRNLQVAGTLSAATWSGLDGGVLVGRASGFMTLTGTITATGRGFGGGPGTDGNGQQAEQGEGELSLGAVNQATANGNGGGAGVAATDQCNGGGGGGNGSVGTGGTGVEGAAAGAGGSTVGDAVLSAWIFGGGGGGGGPDTESDGNSSENQSGGGGTGGGLIFLAAGDSMQISGTIEANGLDGGSASWAPYWLFGGGELGGGGGGAGGTILLQTPTLTLTGIIEALGGAGGAPRADNLFGGTSVCPRAEGGDGGDGRIRLEVLSLSGAGAVTPTPTTGAPPPSP